MPNGRTGVSPVLAIAFHQSLGQRRRLVTELFLTQSKPGLGVFSQFWPRGQNCSPFLIRTHLPGTQRLATNLANAGVHERAGFSADHQLPA